MGGCCVLVPFRLIPSQLEDLATAVKLHGERMAKHKARRLELSQQLEQEQAREAQGPLPWGAQVESTGMAEEVGVGVGGHTKWTVRAFPMGLVCCSGSAWYCYSTNRQRRVPDHGGVIEAEMCWMLCRLSRSSSTAI